jgi:biotin carboxyl carrier protein
MRMWSNGGYMIVEQEIAEKPKRAPMPRRTKILFYLVAWLIVLMPFLFWRGTWFGRPLTDAEITKYLHDDQKPRHIQHALVQIGERINRGNRNIGPWSADLVRLATYPVEEIRNTDAWIMGQDNSNQQFHSALLKMISDPAPQVRGNAALALVRFGDASGRPQIVAMLKPLVVTAPTAGRVTGVARAGEPANHGTVLVKLDDHGQLVEVRAPISGHIRAIEAQPGADVAQGAPLAVLNPGADQVWEALRALYAVGQVDDLPAVAPYKNPSRELPQRIAQQAAETEKAIEERAGR